MQSNHSLISILMPYYRLGDFLEEAVESVKAQTYENWELIVVDDCSPEKPAQEVLSKEKDPRIHIFRHDSNRGAYAARNTAASKSRGEFLVPLDSDDLLAPSYLEKTLNAALETGASAVYSQVKYFGNSDFIYVPSTDLGEIFSGHYPCNTLLMKREVYETVGGYKEIRLVEDTEFWISAIESGFKFAFIPEPLYLYRSHENGTIQTNRAAVGQAFLNVLLMHQESVREHLQTILKNWTEHSATDDSQQNESQLESNYSHLQSEFANLKEKYEVLEKRFARNEEILASLPLLTRQISYLSFKKTGLR